MQCRWGDPSIDDVAQGGLTCCPFPHQVPVPPPHRSPASGTPATRLPTLLIPTVRPLRPSDPVPTSPTLLTSPVQHFLFFQRRVPPFALPHVPLGPCPTPQASMATPGIRPLVLLSHAGAPRPDIHNLANTLIPTPTQPPPLQNAPSLSLNLLLSLDDAYQPPRSPSPTFRGCSGREGFQEGPHTAATAAHGREEGDSGARPHTSQQQYGSSPNSAHLNQDCDWNDLSQYSCSTDTYPTTI